MNFEQLYKKYGYKTQEEFETAIKKALEENKEELEEIAKDWSVCDGDGLE